MSRSETNTTTDSPKPENGPAENNVRVGEIFAEGEAETPSDKTAKANATLSEKLEGVEDDRQEERFIWIVVVVILVDVLWFKDSANPTLPIVVLVLQLVVLLVLARRMGIDGIVRLIDQLLHTVGSRGTNG